MAKITHNGTTQDISEAKETTLNQMDLIAPVGGMGLEYMIAGDHTWAEVYAVLDGGKGDEVVDNLVSALKSAAMALDLAGLVPGNEYWQQQCKAAARQARAALVSATGRPS